MPRILRAREIGDGVIGGFFEQKIAIGAEKGQAAARPGFLVLPVAVFRARLQRRLGVEKKIEAGRACARLGAERRIIRLGRLQIFRRQLFVPGRHRPGRRALEHRERCGLLRDDRNRLDRRGAGADDADTQAGEVDTLMRPFAGVIDGSAKILETLESRTVRRRQAADRHDAEFCAHAVAAVGLDVPAFCVFIERRRGHARVEHDMPAKIEAIGDMVGVGEDFGLRRVFLRPVPLLVQFLREGERVLHALDVATRARIPVPVPGAADAAAGLEHPRRKAEPAQAMQHVHPGKARAHHDGVENRSNFGRALRVGSWCRQSWFVSLLRIDIMALTEKEHQ